MGSLLGMASMAVPFIPGIGPVAKALITAGLATAGGLAGGQGPLSSLGRGAMAGGMQYGMNKLNAGLPNRSAQVTPELLQSNMISNLANQPIQQGYFMNQMRGF